MSESERNPKTTLTINSTPDIGGITVTIDAGYLEWFRQLAAWVPEGCDPRTLDECVEDALKTWTRNAEKCQEIEVWGDGPGNWEMDRVLRMD